MATFRFSILGAAVWLFALGSAQGQVDLGFRTDGLVVEYRLIEYSMPSNLAKDAYFAAPAIGDRVIARNQGKDCVAEYFHGNAHEVFTIDAQIANLTKYCFGGVAASQELTGGARNYGNPVAVVDPLHWFHSLKFPQDSYDTAPQTGANGQVVGYAFVGKTRMLGENPYTGCAELDISGLREGGAVTAENYYIHPVIPDRTCKIDETKLSDFTSKWGPEVGLFPSLISFTRYSSDGEDKLVGRTVFEVVSVKVATEDILAFEDRAQAGLECLSPNEIYSFENKRVEILNAPEGTPTRGGLPTSNLPRILLIIGVGFLLIAGVASWRGMKKKSARRR